ncbi:hypothetical protein [Tenacibaculum sp. MAR_2010_89]|uniref:hypothetical protein n=1 Tax=Tenacibaculum sp. MAR_2010_89 TaxID=1250198 RepID=UPI00159FF20D|nr:hypothetical protein [Tenacibaculum sp. MAR_2010_89]
MIQGEGDKAAGYFCTLALISAAAISISTLGIGTAIGGAIMIGSGTACGYNVADSIFG